MQSQEIFSIVQGNADAFNHMGRHGKEYQPFLTKIGAIAFKRPLFTRRSGVTTD